MCHPSVTSSDRVLLRKSWVLRGFRRFVHPPEKKYILFNPPENVFPTNIKRFRRKNRYIKSYKLAGISSQACCEDPEKATKIWTSNQPRVAANHSKQHRMVATAQLCNKKAYQNTKSQPASWSLQEMSKKCPKNAM